MGEGGVIVLTITVGHIQSYVHESRKREVAKLSSGQGFISRLLIQSNQSHFTLTQSSMSLKVLMPSEEQKRIPICVSLDWLASVQFVGVYTGVLHSC